MRTYLAAKFDSRQSFGQKAAVEDNKLYSYNVLVAEIAEGKVILHDKWSHSATTLRHVKEFLLQNGFAAGTKAEIRARYGLINA